MSQADLLARLEAVTARLERAANKMGGGGGGDDEDGAPSYVSEFRGIVSNNIGKVVSAANDLGLKDVGDIMKSGYDNIADLVSRIPNSKKPDQQALLGFLKPGVDAITQADSLKFKHGRDNFSSFYNACYESINGISWVTMAPPNGSPLGHIEAQRDATVFHLNRILKIAKDKKSKIDSGKAKAFADAFRELNVTTAKYVKDNFKTGFTWNAKGSDLGSASSAPAAAEESKTEAPTTTKKKAGGGGTGFTDVKAQLAALKDDKVRAKSLKTVKDSDKTKNRAVRSGKVTMKQPVKKAGRKKGAPNVRFLGGRWMVENHNEGQFTVDKATLRQNVFICMGDGATYRVPTKVKAVTIDSCNKCTVVVSEVVSTIELINCKSVTVYVEKKAPSISVDKCQSPRIVILKGAFVEPPDIYTSNVSAMNVSIPGKTDDADPIELPIPEQFVSKIDNKTNTLKTTEVTHG